MLNARLFGFWNGLTDALRTGRAQNETKSGGKPVFEALYADEARLEQFLGAIIGALPASLGIVADRVTLHMTHGIPFRHTLSFVVAWLLSIFAAIAIARNRERHRELMPWVIAILMGILAFFVSLVVFYKRLFDTFRTGSEPRQKNPVRDDLTG
jgi:hypothetical protein